MRSIWCRQSEYICQLRCRTGVALDNCSSSSTQLNSARWLYPHHQYADDVQAYGWRPPTESNSLRDQLSSCIQDICLWMRSHQLQLNMSKTEFIWCCPSRRRWHISDGDFNIDADQVKPVSTARNLGVFLNGKMSMRSHYILC